MSRALPHLTWFRAFEAASRHLSFTAAAGEIGLTQSAVSQHVRALETRLGVALFLRLPRGLALTDEGRKLQPQVGAALEMLATATRGYDGGGERGLLTISTSVSIAQWLIAPALGGYLAANPGLRLRILNSVWPDEFKASIADVEVRFGSEVQVGDGATRLLPDSLVAVAAPGVAGEWARQPLIAAVGTSGGWPAWAAAAGIADPLAPTTLVDSHGMALELAVRGAGVALTSSLLAAGPLADGRVRMVHQARLTANEGYFLAVNPTEPRARALGDWISGLAAAGRG